MAYIVTAVVPFVMHVQATTYSYGLYSYGSRALRHACPGNDTSYRPSTYSYGLYSYGFGTHVQAKTYHIGPQHIVMAITVMAYIGMYL